MSVTPLIVGVEEELLAQTIIASPAAVAVLTAMTLFAAVPAVLTPTKYGIPNAMASRPQRLAVQAGRASRRLIESGDDELLEGGGVAGLN